MKIFINYSLMFILLCLIGCSNHVSVKGKVTFSDDGTPVPCGSVCFESDTVLARGTINPDGTYTMGSLKEKDGIVKGQYKVYVSGAAKTPFMDLTKPGYLPIPIPLVAPKFCSATTTPLSITVDGGLKSFDFEVDRIKSVAKSKK